MRITLINLITILGFTPLILLGAFITAHNVTGCIDEIQFNYTYELFGLIPKDDPAN